MTAFDGDHSQLVAASEGSVAQPAARWLKFDVASQAVTSGRYRDDDH
jgi:hypothetical protein